MASAERDPITGVWGRAPIGIKAPGAEVKAQSPPKAERFSVLECPKPKEAAFLAFLGILGT